MNTDIQNYVLSLQEVESNSTIEFQPFNSTQSNNCTINLPNPSGASWFLCFN